MRYIRDDEEDETVSEYKCDEVRTRPGGDHEFPTGEQKNNEIEAHGVDE